MCRFRRIEKGVPGQGSSSPRGAAAERGGALLIGRPRSMPPGALGINTASLGHLHIDRQDRAALASTDGKKLNAKVMELALKLHQRHQFTDAAATDGSKQPDMYQPARSTRQRGKTSYGIWEGPDFPETTHAQKIWRDRIRKDRGPPVAEIVQATKAA